jgi:hypothetical protein
MNDDGKGDTHADKDGYLKLIRKLQKRCATETWAAAPKLGDNAPVVLEALDILLSYIDRAATCFGGCRGGDHRAEYLAGRASTSCQACLLLMSNGYYDEALSIIRNLGEIANLMSMFVADRSTFEHWKSADERVRRREFAPVEVRRRIERHNGVLVVDKERYGSLSSASTHANPNMLPPPHGENGTGMIAPTFQQAGFLLCLNELALSMAFIGVFSAALLELPRTIKDAIQPVCRLLTEHMGGIDIKEMGRPWFSLN